MLVVFVMRSTKRYDVESLPTNVSRPLQLIPPVRAMREPFHWPVRSIVTVIFGFEPLRVPVHLPARLWSGVVAAEAVGAKAAIARMIVMVRTLYRFMAGIVSLVTDRRTVRVWLSHSEEACSEDGDAHRHEL